MPAGENPIASGPEAEDDDRFRRAIEAIDAANRTDPNVIEIDGHDAPKELAHSALVTDWVRRLDPTATDLQLLAARAHHLRRWSLPRDGFDEGRAGYLRWRATLKKRHAQEVGEILARCGYDDDDIERVQRIVRKEALGRDPRVQTHEDALCLVFLQTQFDDVAGKLGDDKAVEVLRKTLRKMSRAAIDTAIGLPLSDHERQLLMRAAAANDGAPDS